jgi:outer membrane protein insertion porin family
MQAVATENNKIKQIVFKGNQRINDVIIQSYLETTIGDRYNRDKVNSSVKNLYKSDLFEDVRVNYRNSILTFTFKENPVISEVYFEGNKKLSNDVLSNEISLTKRSIFTKSKLKNDIKRINDLYRRIGMFSAKIDGKIIKEEGNRIKVVFEINEGKKAKVLKIFIIGNEKISDDTLKSEIFTKEAKYLRFSSLDVYDPERLEYDKELMRRYYFSKGYADFEVLSVVGEIKPELDGFYVTFLVKEGVKYKFGDINIINEVKKLDASILQKKIKIKKGRTFNGNLLNNTVDTMIAEMGKHGYAFVDIEPKITKDKQTQIVNVDFVIHPVRKVYIGRINIKGNVRTLDEVIRRELRIQEGDPYNSTKIDRSLQRLKNLGYFKDVKITTTQGAVRNQIDLTIEITEQKTGELNFGVGYSTVNGANVNVGLKEKNLMGTGRKLSFDWLYSEYTQKVNLGYGKPYFLDRNLYAGFDVFYIDEEDRDSLGYNKFSYGGSLLTSYNITEYLMQQVYYNYFQTRISGLRLNYMNILEAGDTTTALVGQSLTYDRRDNIYNTREGYFVQWSLEYAGFNGDREFMKNLGSAAVYTPIYFDNLIFKIGAKGGVADGLGEPLVLTTVFIWEVIVCEVSNTQV